MVPSYQVGRTTIAPALALAPMSGVTDSPFRRAVYRASGDGVGLLMSEFIKIELLTQRNMRTVIRMAFHPEERPIGIQIYGSDVDKMAEAARMIEDAGADLVDINCGCPAPKIVKRGGGAGLLKTLPLLGEIVEAVVKAVSIPVTVKIRNGWDADSINALETLRVAEESGAAAIAVHGRTRVQLYRGVADWDVVAAMKAQARIPVIGSGDVCAPEDAVRRMRETGADGVMIGRAAIMNPWIFRQTRDLMEGRAPYQPTWRDRIELVRDYRGMLDEMYPPKVTPGRLKMMLSRMLKGFPAGGDVRRTCLTMEEPDAMLRYLDEVCRAEGLMDVTVQARAAA